MMNRPFGKKVLNYGPDELKVGFGMEIIGSNNRNAISVTLFREIILQQEIIGISHVVFF